MAQWVKNLSHKYEKLSLDPRTHVNPDTIGYIYNPRNPAARWTVETGESLGAQGGGC